MSAASVMALVGMFVARMDMVVAGSVVPQFAGLDSSLPEVFYYTPSSFEWIVVLMGISLTGLAFLMGERVFGKVFSSHSEH